MEKKIDKVFGEKLEGVEYESREGAYGIVFNEEGQVAVIKIESSYFLPGGGIERGETKEQCLIREFKEETGHEIEIQQYVGGASNYRFVEHPKKHMYFTAFFYSVFLKEKVVEPIEEDHEFLWMDPIEYCNASFLEHQAWGVMEAWRKVKLKDLHTERLILMPVTLEITKSLLDGSTKEVEKLGIQAGTKWPREDTMDILPIVNKALERDKIPSGFEFWMIVKKENMEIIGDIGFHGKPDKNGEVEIGYGMVDHERRKGYGLEAVKAIIEWAFSQPNVKVVKADCLIDNIPSIRILEKAGMKEVDRDQELIYWEQVRTNS